jgi:hypothetical protein
MICGMDSRFRAPPSAPFAPMAMPLLPAWVDTRTQGTSETDAAFVTGIALKSLDDMVRAKPAWAGCWRQRLALRSAQAAVQLVGRNESENALRDAVLLTAPGDDPGPGERDGFGLSDRLCATRLSRS